MTAGPSFAERVYQLLLRLYPEEFRERYGRAMRDFQRDRVREARASGHATLPIWIRAFADVAVSALTAYRCAHWLPGGP